MQNNELMDQKLPEIIYIAGFERSGSTILDIMLGNMENHFSAGELSFYPTNGIVDNEFCSCGSKVLDCEFWKRITSRWNKERLLSIETYNKVQWDNFRNKRLFSLIKNLYFPDRNFKNFTKDTCLLYQIIWEENGNRVIIDSSKSPYRLLLFKKIGLYPEVIHVVRKISGVLFSAKKIIHKDPSKGIEMELGNRSTMNVIASWLVNNLFVCLFSLGLKRKVIHYEQFIHSPENELLKVAQFTPDYFSLIRQNGPFRADHLVAGGRIRMEKEIYLKKELVATEKWKGSGLINGIVNILDRIKW
jgi:hypothetical protein